MGAQPGVADVQLVSGRRLEQEGAMGMVHFPRNRGLQAINFNVMQIGL